MDNAWSGLLLLAGAAAGYAVFMGLQPGRAAWLRGYGIVRDYPCLWLVAGVFETFRLTAATTRQLATGEISPDAFVAAHPVGVFPYLRDLLAPAGDATLTAMLRLVTWFVDAWPLSIVLAVCLLANVGGALRCLWVSPGGGARPLRRSFAMLAVAAALVHLAEAAVRHVPLPAGWTIALTPLHGDILRAGGDFFVVGCGVAVQVWVVLWAARSAGARFEGVPVGAALDRLGALVPVIVAWAGLRGLWRHHEFGPAQERALVASAFLAAFIALPAVMGVIRGECGLLAAFGRYGLRVFAHAGSAFWWLATAVVHVALLHVTGLGMEAVVGPLPWADWCWGVFFSFLKAGVYVWLLSSFVVLAAETAAAGGKTRRRRQ